MVFDRVKQLFLFRHGNQTKKKNDNQNWSMPNILVRLYQNRATHLPIVSQFTKYRINRINTDRHKILSIWLFYFSSFTIWNSFNCTHTYMCMNHKNIKTPWVSIFQVKKNLKKKKICFFLGSVYIFSYKNVILMFYWKDIQLHKINNFFLLLLMTLS